MQLLKNNKGDVDILIFWVCGADHSTQSTGLQAPSSSKSMWLGPPDSVSVKPPWPDVMTPYVNRCAVLYQRSPNPKQLENLKFISVPLRTEPDLKGDLCYYLFHCRNTNMLSPLGIWQYTLHILHIPPQIWSFLNFKTLPDTRVLNRGLWSCIYLKMVRLQVIFTFFLMLCISKISALYLVLLSSE